MYVHLQSVCTCLHSFVLSLHLFVQYRCAFSFVYVYTSLTTGLHMSALVCVGPCARLHVCTWHHPFPCTCACLHLASLIFTYFCLAPLVSVCLHLSGVYLVSLHLAPLICAHLHLSASGITHFHLFLLGTTCFCLPALVCCVFN